MCLRVRPYPQVPVSYTHLGGIHMNKHKLISVFALALVLTLSLSACSSLYSVFFVTNMQPEASNDYMIDVIGDESEAIGQVNISVIYPEEAETENSSEMCIRDSAQGQPSFQTFRRI